ncbi:MAG: lysylphosphatidylglycerol synthase transmembrane domain-containing protein [Elusimicrobiaceae bacterium]|nr:lysylphosphatidylglycerol synthase transmembrane domain-containing protein [Elusimicrobiaceae bacterium]
MRKFEIVLLAAGAVMLAVILRQMDFGLVRASISAVGAGFALVFFQEIVAFLLNTLGWKFSFTPEMDRRVKFSTMLKIRVAGDGVNYLTPSATLAGEWSRAIMLGGEHALSERLSSVALAKITQALAMVITSLAGIVWALRRGLDMQGLSGMIKGGGWLLAGIIGLIVVMEIRGGAMKKKEPQTEAEPERKKTVWEHLKSVDREIAVFVREYPGRFAVSTFFFLLAYLWGAVEAYMICLFLGVPVSPETAMLIELLSVFMDGIFFAVPGKAGTQEATKTAIFAVLGMKPALGFSFAIVRHLREILWAVIGFYLYYRHTSLGAKRG